MSEGLMQGMLWAGLLLSGVPIAIFIGGGFWLLKRYREEQVLRADPDSSEAGS